MERLKMMSGKWITLEGLVFIKGGMRERELIFSLPCNSTMRRWIQTPPPRSGCHLVLLLDFLLSRLFWVGLEIEGRVLQILDKCSSTDILLFCWFSFVWSRAHAHQPHLTCGGQRTIWRSQVSPSTQSILEPELRLPGFMASTLTYSHLAQPLYIFFIVSQGLTKLARLALKSWSSFSASQLELQACSTKSGFCSLEL